LVQGQGSRENQTGGASEASALRGKYMQYFEDLIFTTNAEIGPKAVFKVASRGYLKNRILVQGDAKLMPDVVQGGREVSTRGILEYFEDSASLHSVPKPSAQRGDWAKRHF